MRNTHHLNNPYIWLKWHNISHSSGCIHGVSRRRTSWSADMPSLRSLVPLTCFCWSYGKFVVFGLGHVPLAPCTSDYDGLWFLGFAGPLCMGIIYWPGKNTTDKGSTKNHRTNGPLGSNKLFQKKKDGSPQGSNQERAGTFRFRWSARISSQCKCLLWNCWRPVRIPFITT